MLSLWNPVLTNFDKGDKDNFYGGGGASNHMLQNQAWTMQAGVKTISLGQIERNSEQGGLEGNNFVAIAHSGTGVFAHHNILSRKFCAKFLAVKLCGKIMGRDKF